MRNATLRCLLAVTVLLVPHASYAQDHQWTAQGLPGNLATKDWSSIREAYEAERHAGHPTERGYEAHNPGQDWRTSFDGRGFVTKPSSGLWSWGLELQSYGFANSEHELTEPLCMNAEGQRVWVDWDGRLEEWYINDGRGLEHGYTLQERPAFSGEAPSGALRFSLAVRGTLRPRVHADARGVTFLDAQDNAAVTYAGLTVFDADGRGLEASFARDNGRLLLQIQESEARYPLTIDPVAQQAYLKASNATTSDWFGVAVAVSEDTVVVGASRERSNATGVNGNQTNNSLSRAGAAYVFVRSGTHWTQQAYLKASNTEAGDEFGWSVAIDGDTVVVGTQLEDSQATGVDSDPTDNSALDSGAAYVFARSGTTWSQQAYLKASNTEASDNFGLSVSVSEDTVVVGAWGESSSATGVGGNQTSNGALNSGAAYVFHRSGTTWSQQAYLKASNTQAGDGFGESVSASRDTIVVGAGLEDSTATGVGGDETSNAGINSGAAYVFVRSGSTWSQQAYIKASNTGFFDEFGRSLAVSDDTVVVGARLEDSSATGVDGDQTSSASVSSGAAYVFVRSRNTWSQQAYLKASNTQSSDNFGGSVSVSGDTVVVGARHEGSNATGVDGDETNNDLSSAGAAYVFVRSGTTWAHQAYLKASNTHLEAEFGTTIAVSGDTVVVGAPLEDSSGIGVGGSQAINGAPDSGAAYVFLVPPPQVGTSLCNGDGGNQLGCTDCPCNNNAQPGTPGGCLNGAGTSARLDATGDTSVTLPLNDTTDLRFSITGAPAMVFCILNSGDAIAPTSMANPCFGLNSGEQAPAFDGLRCATANTLRHGGRSTDMSGSVGATNAPWGGEGGPSAGIANANSGFSAGQTRYFQVIHRSDPLLGCQRGLNTSQAIEVEFTP